MCAGTHAVLEPANPLVPAECSVFTGISRHTHSFTRSHTHRHTWITPGSYKDHLLLCVTTSAWVATFSLWFTAELPLHVTQCLSISAVSGKRNGHSWTQDKVGGKRWTSLTYFKIKNLSNNWNSFCQRWALVTCSPAVKVEFCCLCPKHSEHTWQSDPAFHRQPSPHLDTGKRSPPSAPKPGGGYQGADRFVHVHLSITNGTEATNLFHSDC